MREINAVMIVKDNLALLTFKAIQIKKKLLIIEKFLFNKLLKVN
jgi:hypothetical protein